MKLHNFFLVYSLPLFNLDLLDLDNKKELKKDTWMLVK